MKMTQRKIDTLKNTDNYTVKVSNLGFFMEYLVLIGCKILCTPQLS